MSTEQAVESAQLLCPVSSLSLAGSWIRSPLQTHRHGTDRGQHGQGWGCSQQHQRWQQQQACNKTQPMSYRVYISPTSLSA